MTLNGIIFDECDYFIKIHIFEKIYCLYFRFKNNYVEDVNAHKNCLSNDENHIITFKSIYDLLLDVLTQ